VGITPDVKLPLLNAYVDKLLGQVWVRVPSLKTLQLEKAADLMQGQCAVSPKPGAAVAFVSAST
jgi:hypothetical protein